MPAVVRRFHPGRSLYRGRRILFASAALISAIPSLAMAANADADAPATPADAAADNGDSAGGGDIIVLGTRRANVRALDSTAPVDVVDEKQLSAIGAANLSEALQRISPSVNFPQGAVAPMGAGNARSISLRGLSPDQTLVLINGKRLVTSANVTTGSPPVWGYGAQSVDINAIPLNAISRVEILRDGAAAQYGSDAIAGVVNLVLRSSDKGGDVQAQLGQYKNKAGRISQSYQGWVGFGLPSDGFLTLSFNAENTVHPKSGLPDNRQQYFTGDPREATYNREGHLWGYPPSMKAYNFLANAGIDLADGLEFYTFGSFANILKVAAVNHVTARDDGNVRALFTDGINPFSRVRSKAATGAAGLKYTDDALGAFDLGVNYGRYWQKTRQTPHVNASFGTSSPIGYLMGRNRNELLNVSLDWVKDVPVGFLGEPLNISGGVAYRRERYENIAGERASYANGGVLILDGPNAGKAAPTPAGTTPDDAGVYKRNVKSVYVGIENQVSREFQIGLAARLEDYSDFGSTANGRISARYDFSPAIAIRATASTGYRAPSLGQIGYATTASSIVAGSTEIVKNRSFAVDSPVARLLGAQDLKPEKSRNLSAGLVLRPIPDASLSVDVYQIKVRDKVALSQDFQGPAVRALLAANGYPDIIVARFFTNALDTRTRGIDIVGQYGLRLDAESKLDFNIGYSRSRTKVTDINSDALAGGGTLVVGNQAIWMLEEAPPRDKLVAGATYTRGGLTASLTEKRYGKYAESLSAIVPTLQTFGAQWITDLDVGYRFSNGLNVGIGSKNLFSSKPDKQWASNSRLFQTIYSNLAPEGFDGAYYYARVGFSF